ncbi:GAF domain-containing protein [Xanthomonas campestris]|uniref:GAF domain-containing protein n=1 Tax=Xanthomonas campestris TaxID=339 RepID=UPI000E1F2D50|nr:GAF domain-containing protein [Xanthomonas campestris]
MLIAPYPKNEQARLRLLRQLDILDTAAEEVFDEITRELAEKLQVSTALISLVDADRQWFKSRVGLDVCETSRDVSFCAHAVGAGEPLFVHDALTDVRFKDNPLVQGPPYIRFYAGIPLRSENGLVVGTLCALDAQPKELSEDELRLMNQLAEKASHYVFSRLKSDLSSNQEADAKQIGFDFSPIAMAVFGADEALVAVNAACCALLGTTKAALLASSANALWKGDSDERLSLKTRADDSGVLPVTLSAGSFSGKRVWLQVVTNAQSAPSFVALVFPENVGASWSKL